MSKSNYKEIKNIIESIKTGNKSGVEELYKKYNKLVYGIAFSILKNKDDAEDIVQIVYTKIYTLDTEKLPTDKEFSWLYSVTKNETLTYLKKQKTNVNIDEIYSVEDKNQDIEKIIDSIEYNKLISKLNDKEKEIVSLKILGELSFEEISKVVEEPVSTVKWRYYKSLHSLKMILSNLAMFIITLTLGIKTLFTKEQFQDEIFEEEAPKNDVIQNATIQNTIKEDTNTKSENNLFDYNNGINDADIVQNEVVDDIKEEPIVENKLNSIGVILITISIIFLVFTIIFSKKYQLKLRHKKSK